METGGRSGGQNFPAIEFAGGKSPDLAFSNVDRYVPVMESSTQLPSTSTAKNFEYEY